MSKNYYLLPLFLTIASLLGSCKLPYDDVDLNVKLTPEYAVPLVETSMNIKDLFNGIDGGGHIALSGHDQDRRWVVRCIELAQHIEAGPTGHVDVEQDAGRRARARRDQTRLPFREAGDAATLGREHR